MSRAKKTVLTIVAVFAGLLLLFNTVAVLFTFYSFSEFLSSEFYPYFPFMTPSQNYIEVNDAKFISVDSCIADWDKMIENGEIRVYSIDEIVQMRDKAYEESEFDPIA